MFFFPQQPVKPFKQFKPPLSFFEYTRYLRKIAFLVAWFDVHDDIGEGYLYLYPVLDAVGEGVGFVDMKLSAREEMKIDILIAS